MAQRRLLAWTATAVVLALLLSASGVESRRRSQTEQPSILKSSKNDRNDLQKQIEDHLEYGSKLRWQIVDMIGKIVYDRYDEINLSQLEVLYQIYHETLRRKFNIFEIASSLESKSGGLNAKDICEVVNKNMCASKINSKVCSRLPPSDSRRSTNTTQDIPEIVKKQFPRGVTIPAILKEIRDKKIKITARLLGGLITNIQYDSFENEVLNAEKTLVEYLYTLSDSTVFSPGSNLLNFVSLDLLLKALLEHNNDKFPGPAQRAAIILIDHFERDLNSINNNIEHFGIIYENSTINFKFLFELVIPDDLVDPDIADARDDLEKAIKTYDFVKDNLSIDKYRYVSPDQLVLEILRQMNHVGQKVNVSKNIIKALRMHADFWKKERTIDDVSDFLMLFNAYDNLRDKPKYKQFFQYVNLIKEKLKHSENVDLELTCNMPRPCLRRVLLKILECDMVDDETKKIVSYLILLVNVKGTPISHDRKVPPQLSDVNLKQPPPLISQSTAGDSDTPEPSLPPPKIEKPKPPKGITGPGIEIDNNPKHSTPLPPITARVEIKPPPEKPLPPNAKVIIPDIEVPGDIPKPLPGKCDGADDCNETTGTTNGPIEETSLASKESIEVGTTENPLDPEINSTPEIVDETTTSIPKTTTLLTTQRKFTNEDTLSTTPTISKPSDDESTTPASVPGNTIDMGIIGGIPSDSPKDVATPDPLFEECFQKCIKSSSEEKCEENCEPSTEKPCEGPNCPNTNQTPDCELGSGEDCSTESSSTTGSPSQQTSTSNSGSSVEGCSDSNPENCKKKPIETCDGPDCPTTTEENKVPTTESSEDNQTGTGAVCEGPQCKPNEPQTSTTQDSNEVTNPNPDVTTEHSSASDEDDKLCDTKDPNRQRKSERLKNIRRLDFIEAEEQALNLYDEGDGPGHVEVLRNKVQEDKQVLGPLLQGLTKTEEDNAKHKMHQTELRRSLSSSKDEEEKKKIKQALKKQLRRSLDTEKSEINNQKENSKIAKRRSDNSKIGNTRSDNSKNANRRTEDSKIPTRKSENSKRPNRLQVELLGNPTRQTEDSKIPTRRNTENSKKPNRLQVEKLGKPTRRTEDSKIPTRKSENSKRPNRLQVEKLEKPTRRTENSKVPNRRNTENSKVPNKRTENSKTPIRRTNSKKDKKESSKNDQE